MNTTTQTILNNLTPVTSTLRPTPISFKFSWESGDIFDAGLSFPMLSYVDIDSIGKQFPSEFEKSVLRPLQELEPCINPYESKVIQLALQSGSRLCLVAHVDKLVRQRAAIMEHMASNEDVDDVVSDLASTIGHSNPTVSLGEHWVLDFSETAEIEELAY